MNDSTLVLRLATLDDVDALYALEQQAFSSDRLSRRRLRHWVKASNGVLLLAEKDQQILGYSLALLHRGTRLARLYSIAVSSEARGMGLGRSLLLRLEKEVADLGWLFMRLEVAKNNEAAISLYHSLGYTLFGIYNDYYEDHQDALRMQKRIRHVAENLIRHDMPWYQQTTEFTCGPSALMMAMASLDANYYPLLQQTTELDIWRDSTTIFMTTGRGGCHPVGLALAAAKRGFHAEAWINQQTTLFVDGVRDPAKKAVLHVVDQHFRKQAEDLQVVVHNTDISQQEIAACLDEGAAVIVLISTYRLDGKKAPHWVTVSAMDEHCLYVHDPDPTEGEQTAIDCQYMPIARADFDKMSMFGKERLRTAVVLRKK